MNIFFHLIRSPLIYIILGVLSVVASLLDFLNNVIAIPTNYGERKYYIVAALILIGIFLFILRITLTKMNPIFEVKHRLNNALKEINKNGKYLFNHQDSFGLTLLTSRIEKELGSSSEIMAGILELPALNQYDYIRTVYTRIIDSLGAEDRYYTLSNLNFWSKDKFGISQFIDSNLFAIRDREVHIHRIVIIDNNILTQPDKRYDDFNRVKDVVRILKDLERRCPLDKRNNLITQFYVSHDYINDSKPSLPLAIIERRSSKKRLLLYPVLEPKGPVVTPTVQIYIEKPKNKQTFEEEWRRFLGFSQRQDNPLLSLDKMEALLDQISIPNILTPSDHLIKSSFFVDKRKFSIEERTQNDDSAEFSIKSGKVYTIIKPYKEKYMMGKHVIQYSDEWRLIYFVNINLPPKSHGFVALITTIMAEKKIPVLVHSTFNSQYFLVPNEFLSQAIDILEDKGVSRSFETDGESDPPY